MNCYNCTTGSRVIQCISTRGASVSEHVKNWNNANKIYYGSQRDNKNYPIKKLPETNPPVRHGFIPESFFTTLYEKTGVTGKQSVIIVINKWRSSADV